MTRIWRILIRTLKSLKNLLLIGTFGARYITFDLKKYRRVIIHDTEEFSMWQWGIWQIFITTLERCQNWYFHGILSSKVETKWAKIYRRVIGDDTEEWLKIWRGIDLSFKNWHKEFDKIRLEKWKVSKMYTLIENLKNVYFNGLLLTKVYDA